jgi:hypothetical protein
VRRRDRLWPKARVARRATRRQTAAALVAVLTARMPRAPPSPTPQLAWAAALAT